MRYLIISLLLFACTNNADTTKTTPPLQVTSSKTQTSCLPYPNAYQIQYDANLDGIDQYNPPPNFLDSVANVMDTLSWTTFIALNWPGIKGVAIPNKCIGEDDTKTVWEGWKSSDDVFLPDGGTPSGWAENSKLSINCSKQDTKILMRLSKTDDVLTSVLEPGEGLAGSPLIDQNGNYTRFEVRMNKPTFDYIIQNKLYNQQGQKSFYAANPDTLLTLPRGCRSDSLGNVEGVGSITIKAAWKILEGKDDKTRFHTIKALLVSLDGKDTVCQEKLVGLVALHIVHRTCEAPQGIWSTFEHIDNAPEKSSLANLSPQASYNYYNPACKDCPVNVSPSKGQKSQIVRLKPLEDRIVKLNAYFQSMLRGVNEKSVWQYYQLIGTQWPVGRNPQGSGLPYKPELLANTALESYIQGKSTCMGCHFSAKMTNGKRADFNFQFSKAKK